jgi:hypothetical protein
VPRGGIEIDNSKEGGLESVVEEVARLMSMRSDSH